MPQHNLVSNQETFNKVNIDFIDRAHNTVITRVLNSLGGLPISAEQAEAGFRAEAMTIARNCSSFFNDAEQEAYRLIGQGNVSFSEGGNFIASYMQVSNKVCEVLQVVASTLNIEQTQLNARWVLTVVLLTISQLASSSALDEIFNK